MINSLIKSVIKLLLFAIISITFITACSDGSNTSKSPYGYVFKRCTKNDATPKAKQGDVLFGYMKILLNGKTEISNTYNAPSRLFVIGEPKEGSIDEFLSTLHIGDSAYMIIPADSIQTLVTGREFKPNDKLHVYLTVTQLISRQELSDNQKEVAERQKTEESQLTDYVLEHFERARRMESGLFYLPIYESKGKQAEYGKRLYVNYSVSDTSGNMIETNVEEYAKKGDIWHAEKLYKPFDFILGDDALIPGWTEGLTYMREGSRAKFIIPSRLAYGTEGYGRIKPYTPLVFDVTIVKIEEE